MSSLRPAQHPPEALTVPPAQHDLFAHSLSPSGSAYSALMRAGSLGFVSGLIGRDPVTGELAGADPAAQCAVVLDRLEAVLRGAGLGLEHLVQTTVYLTDFTHLPALEAVFRQRLCDPYPARTIVQVAGLPAGAVVQVNAVADFYRPATSFVAA
ncbi:RidA family protein [Kocuria sp. CPCC 205263]|uniref:RidA family protein n=1 Tax=Kocuria sp. CPCC 205263 TaxID=3073555 RepID=UPI0034D62541